MVGTDPSRPARFDDQLLDAARKQDAKCLAKAAGPDDLEFHHFRRRVTHDDLTDQCAEDDWQTHRTNIIDALAPVGALETALAEHVASVLWRLRRVMMYESASIDERQHLEQLSVRLLPHPLDIDKIIRYEAHLRRLLYEALHELEAMQDARHGKPTPLLRVDVNNDTGTLPAAESA